MVPYNVCRTTREHSDGARQENNDDLWPTINILRGMRRYEQCILGRSSLSTTKRPDASFNYCHIDASQQRQLFARRATCSF